VGKKGADNQRGVLEEDQDSQIRHNGKGHPLFSLFGRAPGAHQSQRHIGIDPRGGRKNDDEPRGVPRVEDIAGDGQQADLPPDPMAIRRRQEMIRGESDRQKDQECPGVKKHYLNRLKVIV